MYERWHEFTVEGCKTGFTQERTLALIGGERFVTYSLTTFTMPGGAKPQVYENGFLFRFERPLGAPTRLLSYGSFWFDDGAKRYADCVFELRDGRHVRVEDGREVETLAHDVPADAWSTAAFELLVERLEPKPGSRVAFTAVHEGDGSMTGPALLAVVGEEDVQVAVDGARARLWRIEETINGKRGRTFWMDDAGCVRVFDWGGPLSFRVADGATALANLPTGWRTLDDFDRVVASKS